MDQANLIEGPAREKLRSISDAAVVVILRQDLEDLQKNLDENPVRTTSVLQDLVFDYLTGSMQSLSPPQQEAILEGRSLGTWREQENKAPEHDAQESDLYFATLSAGEILSSYTCLGCGGLKRTGQPLCPGCYNYLPVAAQSLLPARVHHYITHPLDETIFRDRMKTAIAIIKEKRQSEVSTFIA